jgi:pimeloyl-ACP methyl ester carboxylesterase
MARAVRSEIEAAGHLGHVYASRRPRAGIAGGDHGPAMATPAVVLVHGIGVSHRYLQRLHTELAASVDTYSIDLPGFGSTPRPEHTLSVADHASYILGAMEQLGVLEFTLVGHSMGVQFAIEAAIQQPGRVPYVVLMGPVVDSKRNTVTQQALALGRDSLFFESASSNALVFTDYLRCGPTWYLKNLRVMMEYPTEQRLATVGAPVLVLRGGNDPVAPEGWCRRLTEGALRGRYAEIPGSGHVVQHNRSAEVAEAILSFTGQRGACSEAPREFKA